MIRDAVIEAITKPFSHFERNRSLENDPREKWPFKVGYPKVLAASYRQIPRLISNRKKVQVFIAIDETGASIDEIGLCDEISAEVQAAFGGIQPSSFTCSIACLSIVETIELSQLSRKDINKKKYGNVELRKAFVSEDWQISVKRDHKSIAVLNERLRFLNKQNGNSSGVYEELLNIIDIVLDGFW